MTPVSIYHVRRGRCSFCGRIVPGIPKWPNSRECDGECPRCGRSPLLLDDMGAWCENVAKMGEADALKMIARLDDDREIETLFRVEFLGPNRDSVLNALHARYWEVIEIGPKETARGRALTLAELRAAWSKELENEDSRRMYLLLADVT